MTTTYNLNTLWQSASTELRLTVSPAVFQTFFSQTELKKIDSNLITLSCPNLYLQDLIEKRYYSLIKNIFDRLLTLDTSLVFVAEAKKVQPDTRPTPLFDRSVIPTVETPSGTSQNLVKVGLHPRYTFDSFIVGNSNNFAHAASRAIVEHPGLTYNPFFIWGGVGVGKTHLMQATAHAIHTQNPNLKLLYVTAETFTNDLVSSLRSNTVSRFKDKYRSLDLLLVDDIQFIAGKEYSQEEFFHTFNSLHLSGKQIILTSDKPPTEIQRLEDRLVSRFSGGLTVDIQPPDMETRLAIIKQKLTNNTLHFSEDACLLLANTLQSNIREIEGKLQELQLRASSQKLTQVNEDFVQHFLGLKTNKDKPKIHYRRLLSLTAKYFKVKTSDLCGQNRQATIALARHIAAYLMRKDLALPMVQVGDILGGRDHTSILHAERKIDQAFKTNQQIRRHIMQIRQTF